MQNRVTKGRSRFHVFNALNHRGFRRYWLGMIGSVQAFDAPTRQAVFPHLVVRKDMMNAVALNSMVWQGPRVIGPAVGGIIIGSRLGIAPEFFVASLGFLVMSLTVFTLRLTPAERLGKTSVAQDMAIGLNYVRSHSIFGFLIGMMFFNSVFGASYIFLFPVFAKDVFDMGPSGLGLLSAATGSGALLGTFLTASLGNFSHKGWILLGGAVGVGFLLILFAVSSAMFAFFPLALALVFLAGLSTSIRSAGYPLRPRRRRHSGLPDRNPAACKHGLPLDGLRCTILANSVEPTGA